MNKKNIKSANDMALIDQLTVNESQNIKGGKSSNAQSPIIVTPIVRNAPIVVTPIVTPVETVMTKR